MPEEHAPTPPRRRGRPKTSDGGRGAALTISVTPGTRDLLEATATAEGRSLSQTAELAIERGLVDLGAGAAVSAAMRYFGIFALQVHERFGDPQTSFAARDALQIGWAALAKTAIPYTTDLTAHGNAARSANAALAATCTDARNALNAADLQITYDRLWLTLRDLGQRHIPREEWPDIRSQLIAATNESEVLAPILLPVISAMDKALRAGVAFAEYRQRAREEALEILASFDFQGELDDPSEPGN